MTQIAEALAQAGYQDAEAWPSKALREIAEKAMIAHANDTEAAQREIFDACCQRNSLARALFAPWYREATAALIAEVRRLLRAAQQSANLNKTQSSLVRIIKLDDERAEAAARDARNREIEERARAAAARQTELNEWLNNAARYEQIDGNNWWTVTAARLHQHARRTGHRAKFWNLIADRVPSHDDMRPVSFYLRPDEINPIWNEAWGNENPD